MRRRIAVRAVVVLAAVVAVSPVPAGAATPAWRLGVVRPQAGFPAGVSCWTARDCAVVGGSPRIVSSWNVAGSGAIKLGGTVTETLGLPVSRAVSCVGRWCASVGNTEQWPDGQIWNGHGWGKPQQAGPDILIDNTLFGVSCTSRSACSAVGFALVTTTKDCPEGYSNCMTSVPIISHWNGTDWQSIDDFPLPVVAVTTTVNGDGPWASLDGISCASARACVAVGVWGSSGSSPPSHLFAEHWNGHKWRLEKIPSPRGASSVDLNDVSCASRGRCLAVGQFVRDGVERPLAVKLQGTSWKLNDPGLPAHARTVSLSAVSCTPRSGCVAVGGQHGDTSPLAEVWTNGKWTFTQVARPHQSRKRDSTLTGVSCVSSAICTAVGTYGNSTHNGWFSETLRL